MDYKSKIFLNLIKENRKKYYSRSSLMSCFLTSRILRKSNAADLESEELIQKVRSFPYLFF